MSKVLIRKGRRQEANDIVSMVKGLAKFEKLEPPDETAKRRLIRDIFVRRRVNLLVATINKKLVGYALYFFTYSSFLARPTLYLEDLFVMKDYRRLGIGKQLFIRCIKEAVKHECGRTEWAVLVWNKNAINFYEKLGAQRLTDWYMYRLDENNMKRLSEQV